MSDTDIVKQLRAVGSRTTYTLDAMSNALCNNAADEIERLRKRCEALLQAGQDKGKADGQVFLERVADKNRIAELEAELDSATSRYGKQHSEQCLRITELEAALAERDEYIERLEAIQSPVKAQRKALKEQGE